MSNQDNWANSTYRRRVLLVPCSTTPKHVAGPGGKNVKHEEQIQRKQSPSSKPTDLRQD